MFDRRRFGLRAACCTGRRLGGMPAVRRPIGWLPAIVRRHARLSKICAYVGCAAIVSTPAAAMDWRYCLTTADNAHLVYMSDPIETNAPMDAVVETFSKLLARRHLDHGEVQCPRADSQQTIAAMRDHATDFNERYGNQIARLPFR